MAVESRSIEDFNPIEVGETVDKDFDESQLQLRNDLLEHLRRLVGQADYSDLEFVCKEGEKVKASRLLLVGRSEVFDKMLTNGMLESSQRMIKLPEISSAVLFYILDILYVGSSAFHPLTSWTMALEALSAAHFLFLPNVNRVVRKFMWEQVVQAPETLSLVEAARMLTAAMELKCMDDEDVVLMELVRLLNAKWMEVDCAINLSEEALDYILRKTKSTLKTALSFDEYFRVRGVVLWAVCQGERDSESAKEVEKLVDTAMPFAEKDLYEVGVIDADTEITWLPSFLVTDSENENLRHVLSEAGRKHSVDSLLINIDWSRIPAVLLAKVVRPLQLLPSSKYVGILEYHAIHNAVRPNCKWVHQDVYATDANRFAIHKSKDGPGWAMCQVTAHSRAEMLQWRFHLESVDLKTIQLGVACGEHASISTKVMNDTLQYSTRYSGEEVYVMQVRKVAQASSGGYYSNYYCDSCGRYSNQSENGASSILAYRQDGTCVFVSCPTVVEFTCDLKGRSCNATVEGLGSFETVRNLPPGNIYPLVNLGPLAGPRVRIALVSGFKMF